MPIYEYKCKGCRRVTELMRSVTEYKDRVICKCGKTAKLVIPKNSAILTDGDVKWLESAKMTLPNDAKNIDTRGEYKKYLRDHGLACIG